MKISHTQAPRVVRHYRRKHGLKWLGASYALAMGVALVRGGRLKGHSERSSFRRGLGSMGSLTFSRYGLSLFFFSINYGVRHERRSLRSR